MDKATLFFVKRTIYIVLFTTIILTIILLVGSINSQLQNNANVSQSVTSDQLQETVQVTKPPSAEATTTARETQNEQLSQEPIDSQDFVSQNSPNGTGNIYTFFIGALAGSLITILIVALVSIHKNREEMMKKALQEEKDFRKRKAREKIDIKMDSLLDRFNRVADEAREERINSERLLLRGPKDS